MRKTLAAALLAALPACGAQPEEVGLRQDTGPDSGPTGEADAGREPDASPPCETRLSAHLSDPGFDGPLPTATWTQQSSRGFDIIGPGPLDQVSPPHIAWFGGDVDMQDSVSQQVEVPDGALSLTLRGWVRTNSAGDVGLGDRMVVALSDTSANELHVATVATGQSPNEWSLFQVDLTWLAGQQLTLELRSTNDGVNLTNFYVDSLSLLAEFCE